MRVYISGAITGVKDYKEKFAKAEEELKLRGHQVFNPTCIPNIFDWDQFMQIDLKVLWCCDAIFMLKGWSKSRGARLELIQAKHDGLKVIYDKGAEKE